MRDIHTPVRTMFYNIMLLRGYACYENGAVPDMAASPYVIISDISYTENSNKTDQGYLTQIVLDVVTYFDKNRVIGSRLTDEMAGQILEHINSDIKFEAPAVGLQVVNTKVLSDQKLTAKSDTHRIYRRLIRFEQLIMEV